MQRALAATFGVAIALVAACGTSTTPNPPSATGTAAPASSAPVSSTAPTATAAPTSVPPPAGTLAWPTDFGIEMTAGSWFTSPPFLVPMVVTIEEPGWYAGHLNPVFIDLQRYDGVEPGGIPTRMISFGWPENVRGDDGEVPVGSLTPAAAVDLMVERGSITSGERMQVELFGLEGESIDLHSDLQNNPIFGTADGDFGLGPELDVRLAVLDLGDGLLMVGVHAPAGDLDSASEQAAGILAKVEIVE